MKTLCFSLNDTHVIIQNIGLFNIKLVFKMIFRLLEIKLQKLNQLFADSLMTYFSKKESEIDECLNMLHCFINDDLHKKKMKKMTITLLQNSASEHLSIDAIVINAEKLISDDQMHDISKTMRRKLKKINKDIENGNSELKKKEEEQKRANERTKLKKINKDIENGNSELKKKEEQKRAKAIAFEKKKLQQLQKDVNDVNHILNTYPQINKKATTSFQNITNKILNVYEIIMCNANKNLKEYAVSKQKVFIERRVLNSRTINWIQQLLDDDAKSQEQELVTKAFHRILKISKSQLLSSLNITKQLKSFPLFSGSHRILETNYQQLNMNIETYYQQINPATLMQQQLDTDYDALGNIFTIIFKEECKEIQADALMFEFIDFAKKTIRTALQINMQQYIDDKPLEQSYPFIEKTKLKIQMKSVKRLKAIWYQGINNYHQVYPNNPMRMDHVLVLVVYAHNSDLCAAFRETYRKLNDKETTDERILRHCKFANFGRLLYEAFVFYASRDAQVKILYHGMSMHLLFKTLHCTFDSPTSTTTAQSVACNFGQGGIVMKFESCESNEYIKTFDMAPFTCYDHEEEHLIFETRLHINDMF
eukprot:544807_1